ncbi:hypothetical protein, partial [Streptococcus pneumoniae]|uniref:hypothetical protein n=1 Tax=Streptococcus pneumoniae TaxID=1313 RepID=UPI0018B052A8
RKVGSGFATLVEGTDVTSSFIFDDGQRDTHYDTAKISRNGITLGATDFLLIKLDYFSPDFSQGSGYFNVNSYPVDDTGITANTI